MTKKKPMTKDEAVREARVASSYRGGTWFVTRRGKNYDVVAADMYDSGRHGRVAETIDVRAERTAARLHHHEGHSEVLEIKTKLDHAVIVTKDIAPELFAAWSVWATAQAACVATPSDWSVVIHEANRHLDKRSGIEKGDHTRDVRVVDPQKVVQQNTLVRYRALVDKKFLGTLQENEQEELDRLGAVIDLTIDIPDHAKTPQGKARIEQARNEWDDATHELANTLRRVLDDVFDCDTDKVARAEYYSELQTLLGIRQVKQEAYLKTLAS